MLLLWQLNLSAQAACGILTFPQIHGTLWLHLHPHVPSRAFKNKPFKHPRGDWLDDFALKESGSGVFLLRSPAKGGPKKPFFSSGEYKWKSSMGERPTELPSKYASDQLAPEELTHPMQVFKNFETMEIPPNQLFGVAGWHPQTGSTRADSARPPGSHGLVVVAWGQAPSSSPWQVFGGKCSGHLQTTKSIPGPNTHERACKYHWPKNAKAY